MVKQVIQVVYIRKIFEFEIWSWLYR